jgi:hypothetical protein
MADEQCSSGLRPCALRVRTPLDQQPAADIAVQPLINALDAQDHQRVHSTAETPRLQWMLNAVDSAVRLRQLQGEINRLRATRMLRRSGARV